MSWRKVISIAVWRSEEAGEEGGCTDLLALLLRSHFLGMLLPLCAQPAR